HFRVVFDRQRILAYDVDVALVKFAKPALLRPLAAIHELNLIAPEGEAQLVLVLRHVTGERHGEIKSQRKLGALVGLPFQGARRLDEVHLLLGVPTALGQQYLRQFEGGRLDWQVAESLKTAADRVEHALERELLRRQQLEHSRRGARLDGHKRCHGPPRTRTGTRGKPQRILSPSRLPISTEGRAAGLYIP